MRSARLPCPWRSRRLAPLVGTRATILPAARGWDGGMREATSAAKRSASKPLRKVYQSLGSRLSARQ
jgi:hypothetical protein